MIDQPPRDIWRAVWQVATSDYLLVALLLSVVAGLAITVCLPQMPVTDPVAYARWLSDAQARFGNATATMQVLGLFTIAHSFVFRALLALVAGSLLLRLVEGGERLRQHRAMSEPTGEWHTLADVGLPDVLDDLGHRHYRVLNASPLFQADRWPWADLFPALAHAGGLLFLIGLLITYLWGWQVEGLVVQSGERATLPAAQAWVTLDRDGASTIHSPGLVTFFEERGPGVRAAAVDGTGQALSLQQTTDADPVTQLTLALTEDQYFAIPEAQLIVRLAPPAGNDIETHSPVLVQIYRSPPGRLATEEFMEKDMELAVDNVTLKLVSVPYARLTVTSNPGRWPSCAGLVLLGVGLLGSIAWPARRFWLREESDHVEGTGNLPLALVEGREA